MPTTSGEQCAHGDPELAELGSIEVWASRRRLVAFVALLYLCPLLLLVTP
ncbi:MAG: hypothetical protein M3466_03050 [Gemmatimonadota bacterium]|nr:hypothetical protein [Gemmatimonadota bacterium]